MAAASAPGVWRKGLTWVVAGVPRREFWSRFRSSEREQKKPAAVAEAAEAVKPEPVLVCPPVRGRAYVPPEDLQSRLRASVRDVFGSSAPSDWRDLSLEDGRLKFRLLARLADDLGHAVPNSRLHEMRRVGDVLEFYHVPVQDGSKFDDLVASSLPPNIKITWGY